MPKVVRGSCSAKKSRWRFRSPLMGMDQAMRANAAERPADPHRHGGRSSWRGWRSGRGSREHRAPRLRRIEGRLLGEHFWLDAGDECWFLREYVPGAGYGHGSTNDLISNLKKPPGASPAELYYKGQAIEQLGRELVAALGGDADWEGTVFVPMPPSVHRDEPGYDDRLVRLVRRVGMEVELEVRELLVTTESYPAASRSGPRLAPSELVELMEVDESVAEPAPERVVVFDDVVTAGAHFVAARRILERRFPGVEVEGLFVARTVHEG